MIVDLFEEHEPRSAYDVVIIGTGPAGVTLATELVGSGLTVAALESGGTRTRSSTDLLRATVSEGIEIKEHSRERVFGGTSTTWAGLSRPLTPANFNGENGGDAWPIVYTDLEPYYQAASDRYGFPDLEAFADESFADVRDQGDFAPDWEALAERVYLAPRKAPNFAKTHGDTFTGADTDAILGATAVCLETDSNGRVTSIRYRDPEGRHRDIACGRVVLACGGIENARLLLASDQSGSGALGDTHQQVGRYLMNHPKNPSGEVVFDSPVREVPHLFGCMVRGQAGYCGLHLRDGSGLLDSYVRFEPVFPWTDREGLEAFLTVAKQSSRLLDLFAKRQHGKVASLRDYSETGDESDIQNARKRWRDWASLGLAMAKDSPWIASYLYYRLRSGASPPVTRVRVRNFMEMEPSPDNRVSLSTSLDEHGEPLAHVVHSCGPLDQRSMAAVHQALSDEIARLGVGRLSEPLLEGDPWRINRDASHHMGTTRMGLDPKISVVNADCRLHGVTNAYVAGSSVFTTSGSANPTFTIVALAIRLAAHLRAESNTSADKSG